MTFCVIRNGRTSLSTSLLKIPQNPLLNSNYIYFFFFLWLAINNCKENEN